MEHRRLSCSLFALSVLAACATKPDEAVQPPETASSFATATQSSAGDAGQAIEAAMARYIDAVERGDRPAIAAAHTDDAIVVMPSGPPMKGKAELNQGFTKMLAASSVTALRASNVERTVSGDIAVETGSFEVTMQPKTPGVETTDKGQYMVVWRRQADGSWKIARAINRSDSPPKP